MLQRYDIRAEFRNGTHRDIKVTATTLATARLRAEDQLRLEIVAHDDRISWRGLVLFVGCVPPEERNVTRTVPAVRSFAVEANPRPKQYVGPR